MMFFKVLTLVCIVIVGHGGAFSSAHAQGDASSQEQRRAELRAALKARTGQVPADPHSELSLATPPVKRHLSDLERADLRRQLRQHRRASKSEHP